MTATVFATLKIADKQALARYRERAGSALQKHGGTISAVGAQLETLEGSTVEADTAVVVAFPSADAARAWINDPDLADVHAMRRAAGNSSIVLLA